MSPKLAVGAIVIAVACAATGFAIAEQMASSAGYENAPRAHDSRSDPANQAKHAQPKAQKQATRLELQAQRASRRAARLKLEELQARAEHAADQQQGAGSGQ